MSRRLAEIVRINQCEIQDAPVKTTYGEGMKQITIPVGPDETATLTLHQDAIDLLLADTEQQ